MYNIMLDILFAEVEALFMLLTYPSFGYLRRGEGKEGREEEGGRRGSEGWRRGEKGIGER